MPQKEKVPVYNSPTFT